jgi:hypothetical protein
MTGIAVIRSTTRIRPDPQTPTFPLLRGPAADRGAGAFHPPTI